jgi:type VI secretion system protein VasJ
MPLDVDALLSPTTDPGDGVLPRESERFVDMEREINKLSSLSGDIAPNWNRVEQLASEFLQLQSKDYLVASWLAEAWTQRHAMAGVSAGLALFKGLTAQHWENAVPPVTRLRGRRNAVLWWIDRVTVWLEKQTDVAIGAALAEQMLTSAKALDALFAEKDPDAPSLANLLSHLQRIPVEQPPQTPSQSAAQAPSTTQLQQPVVDPSTTAALESNAPAPATTATNAAAQGLKPANFAGPVEINSLDDVVRLLKPAQDYIAQIGPALFVFDHAHPLSIYLTRFAARSSFFSIPPANNGQTAIMPPPVAIVDAFEKVSASKNAQGLVEFCEARVRSFPFWLDLDYHSARGFAMMGSAGAKMRGAIIELLLGFVDRLPGVEQLTFSNGIPFASLETLTWIKQCQAERSGQQHQDAFGEVRTQALAKVAEGQLDQAQTALQNFIANNRSQREQFRARLVLVQLMLTENPQADLLALVDPLIEDCQRMSLDQWEPELASQAWVLKAQAARQLVFNVKSDIDASRRDWARQELERAIKHLSIVDFVAASRLTN